MKTPVTPEESFASEDYRANQIIEEINKDLQAGKRSIALTGEFPDDFKWRIKDLFERHGWDISENSGAFNFVERPNAARTEKEALATTQLITNLMVFINAQVQKGVRVIDEKLLSKNIEELSDGLGVKLTSLEDLKQFFPTKPDKSFERLLENAGWKIGVADSGGSLLTTAR